MRRVALVTIVLATALAVFGCGSEADTPTEESQDRIELDFEGDQAPPLERVQVEAGDEVELVITADKAGELHVHSSPEETIPYGAGTTSYTLTLDQPGVVDVERHEPHALVLQLEVS